MISSRTGPVGLHLEDVVERGERARARVAAVFLPQLLRDRRDLVLVQEVERRVELLQVDDAGRLGRCLLPHLLLDLHRRRRPCCRPWRPTASGTTSSPKPSTNR